MLSEMLTSTCIPILIEIGIIAALISFILHNKHILISLLCLEGIILALVILIPLSIAARISETIFARIVLLSLGACEASLGLALIVIISRTYGSDLTKIISSK